MPMPLINLLGMRFGRLEVIARDPHETRKWICRCDCGAEKSVFSSRLRADPPSGTRSCGCLLTETLRRRNLTNAKHGLATSREYGVWRAMIQRCEDTNCRSYKNYGGRGIGVCKEWRNSFEQFYKDMGPRPFPKAQIDRRNNDGNYEPSNCHWTTARENQLNRRRASR